MSGEPVSRGENRRQQAAPVIPWNPDAGMHAVTTNAHELAAGMAAGERSLRDFPYYDRRYGERGRRFCGSDTAWLITLCNRTRVEAVRQTSWLGGVLSSRGMPQYRLERHLAVLHEELTRAMPRDRKRFDILQHCRRYLVAQRDSKIDSTDFHRLAREFEAAAAKVRGRLNGMGEVIVSAVADEALGIQRAVPSLESWLCDPNEFPPKWRDAVKATIAAARAVVSGG
jgi:hypothetical protein